MRTTIRMDDELLRDAKRLAAASGRSLTRVIEDALRETIARREAKTRQPRVRIPTTSGNGLHAGVDLDNTSSLLDRMDRE